MVKSGLLLSDWFSEMISALLPFMVAALLENQGEPVSKTLFFLYFGGEGGCTGSSASLCLAC